MEFRFRLHGSDKWGAGAGRQGRKMFFLPYAVGGMEFRFPVAWLLGMTGWGGPWGK